MTTLIGNDLVINENDCNLACEYCLTGQSNLKAEHEEQLIFKTPSRDEYCADSKLGKNVDKIIERIDSSFKTPFLKLTGGEVLLIKNFKELLDKACKSHEVVVLQTNAALIKPGDIAFLEQYDNLVIQISLDSHLHFGNSYRVKTKSLHEKIVNKISALIESDLKTEIYCVLNDRSVTELYQFAHWLNSLKNKTVLFPFPVRGPTCDEFQVSDDQIHFIRSFCNEHETHKDILPPKPYFDRLLSYYTEGQRNFRCHLPRLVISTFSDGVVTACPNIWFESMGSALNDESWPTTEDKVMNSSIYSVLLNKRPRLQACHKCLTPWEMLSIYFEGDITIDELCQAPTYSSPVIREMLIKEKSDYQNSLTVV